MATQVRIFLSSPPNTPIHTFSLAQGAKWIIHDRLGPGVFPLLPKKKKWELNSATEAKITRKGFPFISDYASTAFMIQGTTLKAGLADCGGISDAVGSSEAMTAYVILSRLMSADGLLILRAFSPELFAMGNAPGPFCLLNSDQNQAHF